MGRPIPTVRDVMIKHYNDLKKIYGHNATPRELRWLSKFSPLGRILHSKNAKKMLNILVPLPNNLIHRIVRRIPRVI